MELKVNWAKMSSPRPRDGSPEEAPGWGTPLKKKVRGSREAPAGLTRAPHPLPLPAALARRLLEGTATGVAVEVGWRQEPWAAVPASAEGAAG